MSAAELDLILELLALNRSGSAETMQQRRDRYDRAAVSFDGLVDNTPGPRVPVGAAWAEWSRRGAPDRPVLLYLHGGSYTMGSPASHRHLARAVGDELDASVLTLDYRRPPEAPFPAAVEDAVAAFRLLLTDGVPPNRIAVAGDSAGAGLALALAQRLRAAGDPLPAGIACLSPWADLACATPSHTSHAVRDPVLSGDDLRAMAELYRGATPAGDPLLSPVHADLAGLPPLLIQVGTEEILLDDARMLAARASAAGVPVEYQEYPGMFHVWQYYFPLLGEGRQAVREIGRFLTTATARRPPAPAVRGSR